MQSKDMHMPLKYRLKSKNIPFVLINPLIALLVMEIFYYGNISNIFIWIIQYPREFFLSYVIMFGISSVFYILPRKWYLVISGIQVGMFSILGYISRQKLILEGAPLIPSDFFLAKEAVNISGILENFYIPLTLIAIYVMVIILLALKFTSREKYKWPQKITVFLISATLLMVCYMNFGPIEKAFSLQLNNVSQTMNYNENGMILGFILDAKYLKVPKPAAYEENTINHIVTANKVTYSVDSNFKPNIIFIMSEAFWDPTLMKNVSFNRDPIPFFHSLQKSQTSGVMISPVYGGGTANTEFEVLTGFSTQFLPSGVIAYTQYINRPIEALPTILQRQGYATSAIHAYDNWFYNRNNVYKNMGFDKFISGEFFNNPEYKGQYIRDTELTRKILDEVRKTNKPDFIYAISIQNHWPYSNVENPQNTIRASNPNLSPVSQANLDNYSNTLADVDQSLEQLIEGLKQINEPTEVIFYGDHLPVLGDYCSVYKEAGFIKDDASYQDYLSLYSVPFVTWNNYSNNKQNLRLSANFMGTLALEMAKKSGSLMTDFLANLMQTGSDAVINQFYSNQERLTAAEADQYKQLQYDLLLGNEYAYQMEPAHKPPTSNEYIQGDGPVEITNVAFADGLLTIQGKNFVENDKIYVNGKPIKSMFINSGSMSANLPQDLSDKTRTEEIQIKLLDSMNNFISQSNVYQLPGN